MSSPGLCCNTYTIECFFFFYEYIHKMFNTHHRGVEDV